MYVSRKVTSINVHNVHNMLLRMCHFWMQAILVLLSCFVLTKSTFWVIESQRVCVRSVFFFTRNKTFGASHLLYGGGGYVVNHPVALTLLPPLLTQLHIYKDIRHWLALTQNFEEIAGLAFVKKTQCFTQPLHCTLVPKPQCIKMERLALQCCARERLD